jgi:hypothetical protein
MREEVIEFGSHLEDSCWGALFYHLLGDLTDQGFPVRGGDWCFV